MKRKARITLILLMSITILLWKINVHAESASLSVSSSNVYVGDSFSVIVNVTAAAWDVEVSASGPVSGCTLHEVDVTSDAQDATKTFSASCTATGTGTINLTLSGDISAASGHMSYPSATRSVTVTARPVVTPSQPTNVNPPTDNTNNNNQTVQQEETQQPTEEPVQTPTELPALNITNFEIIGYNIGFRVDRYEYEIDIASNVNKLYILVEGQNIAVAGDKIVDINDKNEVKVKVSNPEGNEKTYIITLNRKSFSATNTNNTKKEETEESGTSIFFYTTIVFGGLCLILFLAVLGNKRPKRKEEKPGKVPATPVTASPVTSTGPVPDTTPIGDFIVKEPTVEIATPVTGDMPEITPIGTTTPVQSQVNIKEPTQEIAIPVITQEIAENASPVNPANQPVTPVATSTSVTQLPSDVRDVLK